MATATLSGYQTTATAVTWTGHGINVTGGLADNEWTDLSDEVDNSTNKYMLADVEIVLDGTPSFTGADSGVEVYLVPSVDGSTFGTWTGGDTVTADQQENNQYFVGFVTTTGATGAQRMILRNVALPNGKYKWGLRNRTGVALNATGNSMNWRPHGYASTA